MKKLFALMLSLITCLAISTFAMGCGEQLTKVSFDSAGGSSVAEKQVAEGSAYTLQEPTKLGYDFAGWYDGETLVETSGTWNIVKEEVVLTARWTAKTYKLFLNDEDSQTAEYVSVVYGEAISQLPTPTKTGYTFAGWKLNGADFTATTWSYTEDKTLVPTWTANAYKIILELDGGVIDGDNEIDVVYGELIPTLPIPTKLGCEFNGWKLGGEYFTATTWAFTENKTLVASYSVKTYNLTINRDNGSQNEVLQNNEFGTLISALLPTEAPLKTGYTFVKWAYANGNEIGAQDKLTQNVEIKAVYNINKYTISVDYDNGEEKGAIEEVEYNTLVSSVLPQVAPIKTGYTFSKWSYANGNDIGAEDKVVSNEIEIKAVYEINKYTISVDYDNGEEKGAIEEVEYNTLVSSVLPQVAPIKTGYTFDKWVYANGNDIGAEDKVVSNEIEIKAVYEINKYTISVDYDNGEEKGVIENVEYNTLVSSVLPQVAPIKTGYTFSKWSYANGNDIGAEDKVVSNEIEIKAVYTANEYKLYLDDEDDLTAEYIEVVYGEEIPQLPTPEKDGYTFVKWTLGGEDFTATTWTYAEDKTIAPEFDVIKYTISVDYDNGEEKGAIEEVEYNTLVSSVLPQVAPTKTGYTFDKWVYANGNDIGAEDKMPTNDIEIKAVYTASVYSLTIKLDVGEVLKKNGEVVASRNNGDLEYSIKVEYGATFSLDGYLLEKGRLNSFTFEKLIVIEDGSDFEMEVDSWSIAGDVVIKAVWICNDANLDDNWTNIH